MSRLYGCGGCILYGGRATSLYGGAAVMILGGGRVFYVGVGARMTVARAAILLWNLAIGMGAAIL